MGGMTYIFLLLTRDSSAIAVAQRWEASSLGGTGYGPSTSFERSTRVLLDRRDWFPIGLASVMSHGKLLCLVGIACNADDLYCKSLEASSLFPDSPIVCNVPGSGRRR